MSILSAHQKRLRRYQSFIKTGPITLKQISSLGAFLAIVSFSRHHPPLHVTLRFHPSTNPLAGVCVRSHPSYQPSGVYDLMQHTIHLVETIGSPEFRPELDAPASPYLQSGLFGVLHNGGEGFLFS
ncbi:hypothetical protein VN12_25120 [Pirellula sp. SH-Sr6A]|uniref:hypothetical protein n=1 Tax=Pirellula sp. SH-Sr6A TaxID=1632865 RepID=UPI00078CF4D4|nr:hypothetical protein [Pirellula sp. SH-Sr6A]AMV35396.1 hypothetical protein VN12_25120 [Pirellula sp. SH-Sr6A]